MVVLTSRLAMRRMAMPALFRSRLGRVPKALVVLYKREMFTGFKSAMGLATPQVRGIYKGVVVLFLGPGATMVLVADQR